MMDCHRIFNIARDIRAKYNTSDPFELCGCMGVHLRYVDLGSLKGLYKYIKKNYFIVINSSLNEHMARIVCCHELCHHILHRDIARNQGIWDSMLYDMSAGVEQEANLLCAELLIDDDDMLSETMEGKTAAQVAAALDADESLVMLKAMSMKNRGYDMRCDFCVASDYLGR